MAVRTYRYHGNKRSDDRSEYIEVTDAHGVRRKIGLGEDVDLSDDQYAELSTMFTLPRSTGVVDVPPPTLSTVRAAIDAPSDRDSIIYDEDKGVFMNTQLDDALKDYLRAIGARGRDPVRKVLVRNHVVNPRAVGLTNWSTPGTAFVSTPAFTDVDDPDFAAGVEYGAAGHCWKGTAVLQAVAGAQIAARFGFNGTSGNVPCLTGQLVFMRCLVKVVDCPPDSKVTLETVFDSNTGAGRTYRVIDTQNFVNPGDIFVLEGFNIATNVQASARVTILNPQNEGGNVEMRVGQAQIVIEPDGDVPDYVDGYKVGSWWDGAANNSMSWGYVWPILHDEDFKGGFNCFQLFNTDVPANASQIADYCVELGLTNVRMSMGGGPMGCDGAWPEGQKEPVWDNDALNVAKLAPELRKRGIKFTVLIGAACTWMSTNDTNGMGSVDDENHLSDWIKLHTSLITFLGDVVDSVEIFNEANLVGVDPVLWNNPARYTDLSAHLYDAIKAMRPDITVLGGCCARVTTTDPASGTSVYDFLSGMYDEVAVLDREPPWDVVSVHPYTDDISTGDPSSSGLFHSGFDQVMRQTKAALHDAGHPDTGIWVTEYGWPIGSGGSERSHMQALCLWRGRMARKGVKAAYFHTLLSDHDIPAGWQQTFSFLEIDSMRRRSAFEAFKRGGVSLSSGWRALALQSGWNPFGTPWTPIAGKSVVAVRKDDQGNVELRGIINKTLGAPNDLIATLPPGYLPSGGVIRPIVVYNGSVFQMGALYISGRSNASPGTLSIQSGGSIAAGALNMIYASWQADE